MGFEPKPKTFRLIFDDGDYAGAEVVCRSVTVDEMDALPTDTEGLRRFGDLVLESWNVEKNGKPLPANGEGMVTTDGVFALTVMVEWAMAVKHLVNVDRSAPMPPEPIPMTVLDPNKERIDQLRAELEQLGA